MMHWAGVSLELIDICSSFWQVIIKTVADFFLFFILTLTLYEFWRLVTDATVVHQHKLMVDYQGNT